MKRIFLLTLISFEVFASSSFGFLKLWEDPIGAVVYNAYDGLYPGKGGLPGTQVFMKEKMNFNISYSDWLLDLKYTQLKFSFKPLINSSIEVAMRYLDYGGFQGYDTLGQRIGDFTANDFALYLRYAYIHRSLIGIGLETGYATEKIKDKSASTFFAGFGLTVNKYPFVFGTGARNIGAKVKFNEEEFPIPFSYYLFTGYSFKGIPLKISLGLTFFQNDLRVDAALCWNIKKILDIFISYQIGQDFGPVSGLKAGLKLKYRNLNLNYGFFLTGDFGITNHIGIEYNIF